MRPVLASLYILSFVAFLQLLCISVNVLLVHILPEKQDKAMTKKKGKAIYLNLFGSHADDMAARLREYRHQK